MTELPLEVDPLPGPGSPAHHCPHLGGVAVGPSYPDGHLEQQLGGGGAADEDEIHNRKKWIGGETGRHLREVHRTLNDTFLVDHAIGFLPSFHHNIQHVYTQASL